VSRRQTRPIAVRIIADPRPRFVLGFVGLLVGGRLLGLDCCLSIDSLAGHRAWLVGFVAENRLGVSLTVCVGTTFIGILPGGLVTNLVGAGVAGVLDAGGTLSLASIMTPERIGALALLALPSLVAIPSPPSAPCARRALRRDASTQAAMPGGLSGSSVSQWIAFACVTVPCLARKPGAQPVATSSARHSSSAVPRGAASIAMRQVAASPRATFPARSV
jgi:hypothetical protein